MQTCRLCNSTLATLYSCHGIASGACFRGDNAARRAIRLDANASPAAPIRTANEAEAANSRVLMTAGSSIDYDALTQDAMRSLVRNVIAQVVKTGLPGDHHFYIAFNTQAPGVVLSRRLREKYPDEMMVVLQHRFWDLAVTDEGFEVKLTFDGIPERLYVPFSSLRVFFDPSVRFTLQFGENLANDDPQDGATPRRRRETAEGAVRSAGDRRGRTRARSKSDDAGEAVKPSPAEPMSPEAQPAQSNAPAVFAPRPIDPKRAAAPPTDVPATDDTADQKPAGAKVVSLDQFRKK